MCGCARVFRLVSIDVNVRFSEYMYTFSRGIVAVCCCRRCVIVGLAWFVCVLCVYTTAVAAVAADVVITVVIVAMNKSFISKRIEFVC